MQNLVSRPVYALLAICALSATAAYLLRLSPTLRLEAEVSGVLPEVALARLAQAQRDGLLDANLELKFGELAFTAGDARQAREVFAQVGSVPAFSSIAEAHLAEVFAATGDLPAAASHLEASYREDPSAEKRMSLGGWYRLLGDRDAEAQLLSSVAPAELSEPEALRLLDLDRAVGRTDRIETLLSTLSEAGGEATHRWRLRYLEFLLDADRPQDTWRLALDWWMSDTDPAMLCDFVRGLLGRGAIAEATKLEESALARRPDAAHSAIPLFVESGHGARGVALEELWLSTLARPNANDWSTVVAITARSGSVSGVWMLLQLSRESSPDPKMVAAALEQVLRYQGPGALAGAREWLTPAVTAQAPLLEAALAANAGREDDLYSALLAAARQPMEDWEAALWASIANRLRGTSAWKRLFSEVPADSPAASILSQSVIAVVPLPVSN